MGVSISMDDFGTGYSSLSSLKILPINLLKIDKSLIDDIETNDAARSIVKAIVDLGKAMNLEDTLSSTSGVLARKRRSSSAAGRGFP